MTGMMIDYETADRITVLNLIDMLERLEKENKDCVEKGTYVHPEDFHKNETVLIPALKVLIKYFGG